MSEGFRALAESQDRHKWEVETWRGGKLLLRDGKPSLDEAADSLRARRDVVLPSTPIVYPLRKRIGEP